MYIDIHTHQHSTAEGIDSRPSYRPLEEELSSKSLYTVGLHPCYAEDLTPDMLSLLESRLLSEERIWAIGEAGLDKTSKVDLSTQLHYFRQQAILCELYAKPLIIHCVRAYNEVIQIRQEMRPKQNWLIHGFRRNRETAEQLIRAGIYLSFGIHFHTEALLYALRHQKALLETDAAPLNIIDVYQKAQGIAERQLIMEISRNLSTFARTND